MKIQIASDLHAEFHGKESWSALLARFTGEADVLVLAGDIVPLRFVDQVRDALGPFCERYEHVVYVPGNHEYYGTDPLDAHLVLGAVENELSNLIVLKNSERRVNDIRFYGGSMWFRDWPWNWKFRGQLNDFELIRKFEPWVYEQEKAFFRGYDDCVSGEYIIVSHHLPSLQSCHPRFRQNGMESLNSFFVNPMEEAILMRGPRLWLHGHTHTGCDYSIGRTRVVCNPHGYPHEASEPLPEVIIDV